MRFKLIACVNDKLALGNNGNLLYHIGNDLKNFKRITTGGVVIMGRKTFESLSKPLEDRINIVITKNEDFNVDASLENVIIVHSVEDSIEMCEALYSDKECYVIGGESIYTKFLEMDMVDAMYITNVNDDANGDVFFPDIFNNWRLFYQSYTQRQRSDEITYKFSIYKKI